MITSMKRLTRMSALAAALVLAAWFGHSSQGPSTTATDSTISPRTAAASTSVASPVSAHAASRLAPEPAPPAAPPPVDPGTLPQTRVLPRGDDPALATRVQALWQAIVDDRAEEALAFFFPKAAYVQLKALSNAAGDYDYRLVGYYELDVHAAHRLLGHDAANARLVGLSVPTSRAEWMWPGSEENKVPYYRVYGTRLNYTVGGKSHSVGVFSMLSWRGQWYGIHFGPWPRWERYGDVDEPR
jgi:hypothetical protein